MINTKKEALATHLGMDSAELSEYRYHYGRTSVPVYAIGGDYYCVVKYEKPAKHINSIKWDWVEVTDLYINKFGFKIFRHKS